ncbi:NUDIX domain-containing protein [Candidatus Berkelbacteria bacterium]|nr:NUDIX domain-containing protein [Candidatus Berkelbacteria bacterium]
MQPGVDHIGVTCIFACHDDAGRIVLAKRNNSARDEKGRWDLGGGRVHFGETLEQTVRREVREEYGTDPIEVTLLHAYSALRMNDGVPTHWVALLHAVRVNPAEVYLAEPHKFTELGWFSLEALPTPLHSQIEPNALPALQRYFSQVLIQV